MKYPGKERVGKGELNEWLGQRQEKARDLRINEGSSRPGTAMQVVSEVADNIIGWRLRTGRVENGEMSKRFLSLRQ